jgi:hypothetical protein
VERFVNRSDEVKTFLESKIEVVDSLNDYSWLTDLAFIANVTLKPHILKTELQIRDRHMADMIGSVYALKSKLLLWKQHLDK